MKKSKLLLLGYGKMGGSFIHQLHPYFNTTIVDPINKPIFECNYFKNINEVNDSFDTIVFGVKPNELNPLLSQINNNFLNDNCRMISLIAGAKTSIFKKRFGNDIKVTLCMANLPVKIGKGVAAIFSDSKLDYLEKLGQTIYISKESDIGN